MRRMNMVLVAAILTASVAVAQQSPSASGGGASTQPATRPTALPADQLLSQMLRPDQRAAQPIRPAVETDVRDITSGRGAMPPNAPVVPLLREGTFIVDRTGRLTRANDGASYEFVFEVDGKALRDPPMMILPNLRLQTMEDAIKGANRDLRFRITGAVTEYRGRNAVLIEKVVVVSDAG